MRNVKPSQLPSLSSHGQEALSSCVCPKCDPWSQQGEQGSSETLNFHPMIDHATPFQKELQGHPISPPLSSPAMSLDGSPWAPTRET